jgi:hypothetical protein
MIELVFENVGNEAVAGSQWLMSSYGSRKFRPRETLADIQRFVAKSTALRKLRRFQ